MDFLPLPCLAGGQPGVLPLAEPLLLLAQLQLTLAELLVPLVNPFGKGLPLLAKFVSLPLEGRLRLLQLSAVLDHGLPSLPVMVGEGTSRLFDFFVSRFRCDGL